MISGWSPCVFEAVTFTVRVEADPAPPGTIELGLNEQVRPVGMGVPQLRLTLDASPLSAVNVIANVVEPVPVPAMV
jgi:hypothetical protein